MKNKSALSYATGKIPTLGKKVRFGNVLIYPARS
jgi:hypothetical protein